MQTDEKHTKRLGLQLQGMPTWPEVGLYRCGKETHLPVHQYKEQVQSGSLWKTQTHGTEVKEKELNVLMWGSLTLSLLLNSGSWDPSVNL